VQKLKGYYGNIGEKQFRQYYKDAVRLKGDTSQNLIGLLEQRLDAVVYRMKLAPTVFAARQLVSHGHILVNGKRLNIGSYKVKPGEEIEVREKSKSHQNVIDGMASPERDVPEYLELDEKKAKGKFIRVPVLEDVPYPVQMEPNLVVEFYSR
jgi:small subunit ribosomal protein S4